MEEVAILLGLKLNEEFLIHSAVSGLSDYKFRFTDKVLEYYNDKGNFWNKASFDTLCNLLNGKYTIISLPKFILSEKEKKYLSDFIDPFKSQVTYIEKRYLKDFKGNEKEFISIGIKENEKYWRQMELPLYDAGKHYKGMEIGKEYSIKDLGL